MKKGGAFVLLFRKELNVWRTLKFSNRGGQVGRPRRCAPDAYIEVLIITIFSRMVRECTSV